MMSMRTGHDSDSVHNSSGHNMSQPVTETSSKRCDCRACGRQSQSSLPLDLGFRTGTVTLPPSGSLEQRVSSCSALFPLLDRPPQHPTTTYKHSQLIIVEPLSHCGTTAKNTRTSVFDWWFVAATTKSRARC